MTKRLLLLSAVFLTFASLFAQQQTPLDLALRYVENKHTDWQLTPEDITDLAVGDQYESRHNGVTHIYFQQRYQGIRIYQAVSGIHIGPGGKVVYATNGFQSKIAQRIAAMQPILSAREAVRQGALQLEQVPQKEMQPLKQLSDHAVLFTGADISESPIPVELVFMPMADGKLHLAWDLAIDDPTSPNYWSMRIDARTGQLLSKENWTLSCQFGETESPEEHLTCLEEARGQQTSWVALPQALAKAHATLSDNAQYRVFPVPLESPSSGQRTLITNPADPIASPFGWHDTNGVPGAEYTITRGNNVITYLDRDANNESDGEEPDGGAPLVFDFPFDDSATPDITTNSAVTQLFYMNNFMHDFTYHYGFDEEAGNFQQNLYGRQGRPGDPVRAEAQDASGRNNANFSTPPDGANGRMQMFIWGPSQARLLTITEPASLAGTYNTGLASFGPVVSSQAIEGVLNLAQDASSGSRACSEIINGIELEDGIALIDRGDCAFKDKVLRAEAVKARAVIIANTEDQPVFMGGDNEAPFPSIPAISIPLSLANRIKTALRNGEIIRLRIQAPPGPSYLRDASLDNGIIAHEYGHGISNRLTGGPTFTNCLFNDEQMGEGWSDFFTLVTSVRPGDNGTLKRGIGTYSSRDVDGIRRKPYSTDFSINNQTYKDIMGVNGPHPLGEIWAATLWDIYWALVDRYGWNEDIFTGDGGNNMAIQLVIDGMKLQNCRPGFIDGRDAIIAADIINNNGANECLLWEIFARRGLGWSAKQGSSDNRNDNSEAFDLRPECIKTLKIAKTSTPLIKPGDTLTVRLSVVNHRDNTASNVQLTDEIPADAVFLAGSLQGATTMQLQGGILTIPLGDLATGEFREISYKLVSSPARFSERRFFDDMENGSNNWVAQTRTSSADRWQIQLVNPYRGRFAWNIPNGLSATDATLQLKSPIQVPANKPFLRFYHQYAIDPGLDGGIIEISTNGTNWTAVPRDLVIRGNYDGPLDPRTLNVTTQAYWGQSPGYVGTYVNLQAYAGQNIQVRFRFGSRTDDPETGTAFAGWNVDDVEIFSAFQYTSTACLTDQTGSQACTENAEGGTFVETGLATSTPILASTDLQWQVFPNPGSGQAFLQIQGSDNQEMTWELVNTTGQLLQQGSFYFPGGEQLIPLPVAHLPSGLYLVRLRGKDFAVTQKWLADK